MNRPALDGVRVLDLTAWQAGPTMTMVLADFGADVVKVEAPSRLDGWRGAAGLLEDKAYEKHPLWLTVNRGKRGISLDLKADAGREVFLRLVAEADVVAENFTPRVMASLGLGHDVLRGVNERIIVAALSGFGATGPWRDHSAFAFPTEEVSGLAHLTGVPGGPPRLVGHSVTDVMAGAMGAVAVLAALHKREVTGRGDFIDLSQIETLTTFMAGELVDVALNGRDAERRGNQRPGLAPHGLFPCLPEGDLVAIAVRGDEDWDRLCEVVGDPALAGDRSLATVQGRVAARQRVEEAIRAWTCRHDGADVVARLQQAGVPSAVVARPSHLLADEQLWDRGFFPVIERAEVGAQPYPGPVVRLHGTPARFDRPAPFYGEHTAEVLAERLGFGDADLQALRDAGVTSDEPAAQDWR